MKKEETDRCSKCKKTEDFRHIIFECDKYNEEREEYENLKNIEKTKKLIKENDTSIYEQIIKYLNKIKINI